jgi:drug/metabolite transporter (DMT)-like permease
VDRERLRVTLDLKTRLWILGTIGATAPFLTAALAWCFIGEREDLATLAASLVAVLGVVVMVGEPDGGAR